jgi:hypothetical protein
MTDDYTPKPAFHVYRDLIDALSLCPSGGSLQTASRFGF